MCSFALHALSIYQVAAELLGTFLLVFTVLSALITNEAHGGALGVLGVAVAGGAAVVVVVSSIFHVSGGHVNPAVSVAMAVFGHLPPAHLALYAAAQLLGSVAASFVAKALYAGPANLLGPTVATVPSVGASQAFWVEFITTFVVLFVVTALATDPKAVMIIFLIYTYIHNKELLNPSEQISGRRSTNIISIPSAGERNGGSGSWRGGDDERSHLRVRTFNTSTNPRSIQYRFFIIF